VALVQSDDEGDTWHPAGSRPGAHTLVGVDAQGVPLVRAHDGALYRWGSIAPLPKPASASVIATAGGWWAESTGEYFDLDGRRLFEVRSLDARSPQRALLSVSRGPDGRTAALWSAGEPSTLYLSVFRGDGSAEVTVAANFRPITWLDATHVLGMAIRAGNSAAVSRAQPVPAIFDLSAKTISIIEKPFTEEGFTDPSSLVLLMGVVPR